METENTKSNETETVLTIINQPVKFKKEDKSASSIIHLDQTGRVDLTKYSETELSKFKQLSEQLKSDDQNSISNFGLQLQTKLAGYSDQFLSNVRAFDAGEVGTSITDLLAEINYVDIDPSEQGPFKRLLLQIPGIKNLIMNTKKIFQKYDTISGNIDGIVKKLDKGRLMIIRDNGNLQNLFEQNVQYIHQLEELIVAAQIKQNEMESELAIMEQSPENYQDYQINDMREFINRLSKRLTDMQITRTITIQSLPQIRLVQNNNNTMVEKIQSSITTTIPLWKNQISIAVALMRQKGILEVQEKVYDATNTILKKNAELLKQNSIDVAKQNERAVVSIDTLHEVNQKLVETLTEVKRIKEEGENTRRDTAKKLEALESDLKKNVLQLGA